MKNKNRTERCDICCRKIFEEETIRIKIEVEDFESWEMKVCFDCWIRKEIEKCCWCVHIEC